MDSVEIGVAGAGIMGAGIAQRCATHGHRAVLVDTQPDQLRSAEKRIRESLEKLTAKGGLSADAVADVLERIRFTSDRQEIASCGLVIEAVPEDLDLKKELFADLDRVCQAETILASNTSSLSVTALASVTGRPEKVLGIHFMNPVPLMDLVEIVRGKCTSEETVQTALCLVSSLGCEWVECRDSPGFIINRLLIPMIHEAIVLWESGAAGAEDIDRAMVLGTHHPMGPLALADLIGLDTVLSILRTLDEGVAGHRFRPCALLKTLVRENRLGRKTGQGIYRYG